MDHNCNLEYYREPQIAISILLLKKRSIYSVQYYTNIAAVNLKYMVCFVTLLLAVPDVEEMAASDWSEWVTPIL